MAKNKSFIAIYGATSVGKTALADQLALFLPIEIINMDVGQLYKPFTIGTAKPDWAAEKTPHHMFDAIDEPIDCSVTRYCALITPLLEEIWKRKKIPVFVGGSGFYLKSLLFPPNSEISKKIGKEGQPHKKMYQATWQELNKIDPKRAAAINKNDLYRIKRALTIWHATGKKPSTYVPKFKPIADGIIVHAVREREELYGRINKRTYQMIEDGWFDEVRAIEDTPWADFICKKKLIGYDTILAYLLGNQPDITHEQIIEDIQRKTRNYAKRQMTFWRMLERELNVADPAQKDVSILRADLTLSEPDLYIKQLVNLITKRVL